MVATRRTKQPASKALEVPQKDVPMLTKRMVIEYVDLNDIVPYPYNPRDNEKAIPAVAASIKAFGFLVPCVIDDSSVLVAGHTRVEGAKLLGMTEAPCIRASHLTQEQINAFRLIDNQVAEQAAWDFDLLAGEISKLSDAGIQWTDFGWSQEAIDCMTEIVASDCLDAAQTAVGTDTSQESATRRSPTTARFVLGELVFFLPATQYRSWVTGVRELCDYNEEAITNEIKRRLGLAG